MLNRWYPLPLSQAVPGHQMVTWVPVHRPAPCNHRHVEKYYVIYYIYALMFSYNLNY
jgi:hypothetical protein